MKEQFILNFILGILIFEYLLDRVLSALNERSSKKPIPEELIDIYDQESYDQSQRYQRATHGFSRLSEMVSFILIVSAIWLGWFGALDSWIRDFSPIEPVTPLIFFEFFSSSLIYWGHLFRFIKILSLRHVLVLIK